METWLIRFGLIFFCRTEPEDAEVVEDTAVVAAEAAEETGQDDVVEGEDEGETGDEDERDCWLD